MCVTAFAAAKLLRSRAVRSSRRERNFRYVNDACLLPCPFKNLFVLQAPTQPFKISVPNQNLCAKILVQPSGIEGLIVSQPARGFASMVQRKGLAMVRLK